MTVKKLYFIPSGFCKLDSSVFDTSRSTGKLITAPVWSYLLITTDGPILIDTGMPYSCIDNPEGLFRGTEDEGMIIPEMKKENLITNSLKRAGCSVDDIACVISSHWHFDHAGGNSFFKHTEIVVQQKEYDAGMSQPNYFDICSDPALNYHCIDGDTDLPGVSLILTPGHTPGHQSVVVYLENRRPVLLTIDASYCRENYEENIPFAVKDPISAKRSIEHLKEIAREDKATVFFGHDPIQGASWRKFLERY